MFKKILVANRGEIACRIIKACKAVGAQAVAVYSEADKDSAHVQLANEAVCIGPAPATQSYLNQESILKAAQQTECQALHPGYGFLAENALFATRCELQKLTFIGPTPSQMRLMGDKASARTAMRSQGVADIPGTAAVLTSISEAEQFATQLDYPVLLKATAGGGGRGMRLVNSQAEMKDKFNEASNEALKAFGNGGLYLEKYLGNARHIEFQVLGDTYGNVIHLGERECSAQRRRQKLLEEAPSPLLTPEKRAAVGKQVCEALKKIGYRGAGTVEFLFDEKGNHYFIEMNTRIQVEHGITELICGVDLVAWQIKIAAGEQLTLQQKDIHFNGYAIECRVNAEDASNNFQPKPGAITNFMLPGNDDNGPVRIDTHIGAGTKISPYYDSMIAKVMTQAKSREDAIALMQKTLSSITIEGVPTTIAFQQEMLAHKRFKNGTYDCSFVETELMGN